MPIQIWYRYIIIYKNTDIFVIYSGISVFSNILGNENICKIPIYRSIQICRADPYTDTGTCFKHLTDADTVTDPGFKNFTATDPGKRYHLPIPIYLFLPKWHLLPIYICIGQTWKKWIFVYKPILRVEKCPQITYFLDFFKTISQLLLN